MTAGDSKAALTITPQPALAPSPQPRPAPTARALPPGLVAQVGQNWTPIVGQNWMPIDRNDTKGGAHDCMAGLVPCCRRLGHLESASPATESGDSLQALHRLADRSCGPARHLDGTELEFEAA